MARGDETRRQIMSLFWTQQTSLLGPPGPISLLMVAIPTPQVNEKRILVRAPQPLIISRVDALLTGGGIVSLALRHGPDTSAEGTAVTSPAMTLTSNTTGVTFSSFESPDISAEHWLWLEVTAVNGSPADLTAGVILSRDISAF
jgi:hypothetical protein